MNHRHFKLNQVKVRIEGRKTLYKQFRAVSKEELKEKLEEDTLKLYEVIGDLNAKQKTETEES